MELRNGTRLQAGWTVRLDGDAAERLVVAARGTWDIAADGTLTPTAAPPPFLLVDEHHGDPATSSISYEADLGPAKPTTDIALVGSAVAPTAGTTRMEVVLRVGALEHRAVVLGERHWRSGLFGGQPSDPAPFERMPLTWEHTFGGCDISGEETDHASERRNPCGRGFRSKRTKFKRAEQALPCVIAGDGHEDTPVGFGFIAAHWQPRLGFGGTYDQAWREERFPLLPADFDPRFFNCAAPGLTTERRLVGGEAVEVIGCTALSPLRFDLPRLQPTANLSVARRANPLAVPLDLATVLIDTERMHLRLLWRGEVDIHRQLPHLTALTITAAEGAA